MTWQIAERNDKYTSVRDVDKCETCCRKGKWQLPRALQPQGVPTSVACVRNSRTDRRKLHTWTQQTIASLRAEVNRLIERSIMVDSQSSYTTWFQDDQYKLKLKSLTIPADKLYLEVQLHRKLLYLCSRV